MNDFDNTQGTDENAGTTPMPGTNEGTEVVRPVEGEPTEGENAEGGAAAEGEAEESQDSTN